VPVMSENASLAWQLTDLNRPFLLFFRRSNNTVIATLYKWTIYSALSQGVGG
jgi:hypothetical protein